MSNCHTLTWYNYPFNCQNISSNEHNRWDALFNGDYEFIEEDIPVEWRSGQLLGFKPSSSLRPDAARLQHDIMKVSGKINFELYSGWTKPNTGLATKLPDGECGYGRTSLDMTGGTNVFIGFELLEALMRDDLTSAERKLDVYRVTSVLLHEICVCYVLLIIYTGFHILTQVAGH